MIYNVEKILNKYSSLRYEKYLNGKCDVIEGSFTANAVYLGENFMLNYSVYIELYPDNRAPIIKETSKKIDSKFPHINPNGTLCLSVETEILDECTNEFGFDVEKWFNDFVISYFYSYEYFKKYGICPFGERQHGADGILEYYQQKFCVVHH